MDETCPNCGKKDLHCYYVVKNPIDKFSSGIHFIAQGAKWEWCSQCRCYIHSNSWVPDWWNSEIEGDLSDLTVEPEVLENLLSRIEHGEIKVKKLR